MASFSIQTLLGLKQDPAVDQLSTAANHSANEDDLEIIDVVNVDCEPVTVDVKTVNKGGPKNRARKRPRQEDADSMDDNIPSPTPSDSDEETSTPQGSPAANNDSPQSSSDESATCGGGNNGKQKSKRLRTAFTVSQLRALEYSFRMCPYPDSYGREQIAKTTGIDEAKIQVWFQNRRARYRKREKPLEPPQKTTPTVTPLATSPGINPQTPHPSALSPAMLQAYYATAAALHHNHQYNSTVSPASPAVTMATTPPTFFPPNPWYHHLATNPYAPYFTFPPGTSGSLSPNYRPAPQDMYTATTKKFTGESSRSPK